MKKSNVAGCLYVVATPIGNLGDMSHRAIEMLKSVDAIAAEDTRHSGILLKHFQIETRMISVHQHNEAARAEQLVARLLAGESIALISDAGTPLVSDPGQKFIEQAHARGVRVVPIPGASAVLTALSAAGLPSDGFYFVGFLSAKASARQKALEGLVNHASTMVFFEAPHRIIKSLETMEAVFGGARQCVIARELTKLHEQIVRTTLAELPELFAQNDIKAKGEFVVIVEGCSAPEAQHDAEMVLKTLMTELSPAQAAKLAAQLTGVSKNKLYRMALGLE